MPRVNLGKPEVDKIKGLILERQNALGYSQTRMAKLSGYSQAKYYRMMNEKSSKDWPLKDILKLTNALGISKDEVRAAI